MRRAPLVLAALSLLVAVPASSAAARTPKLPTFSTCEDLVAFGRAGSLRPTMPVRVDSVFGGTLTPRAPSAKPAPRTTGPGGALPVPAVAPAAATDTVSEGGTEAFSGTNVQEAGVDEPDVVKTDGKCLFLVAGTELWAYDVTGDVPKLISKLSLEGAGGELLLHGNRLLLLGPVPTGKAPVTDTPTATTPATRAQATEPAVPAPAVPAPAPAVSDTTFAPTPSTARLAEIDVRDTAAMKIVRTMTVPGDVVSARLSTGSIRVVVSSPATVPGTAPGEPQQAVGPAGSPSALAAQKAAKKLRLRNFVPRTVLKSRRTKRTFRRNLVPCDAVRHPAKFAGLDLLTVLTVNFDAGLFNVDRDAVMASAQLVYASASNLYVASMPAADITEPSDVRRGTRTEIHRFDASKPGETTYTSSGSVAGFVLNSYAMSEHEGDLRVAATEFPLWLPEAPEQPSTSSVTVLREQGSRLEQVGRVGGLGKGERIYATRFIGDVGYLVTFRQTDPLYTLDLKDPAAPKVVGELKINGYSAYLHPIGDGLLLGVGQDATDAGRRIGAQASVFDVSNPAAPVRLSALALGNGSAPVEFDARAFLWWAPSKMAVLPVLGWDPTTYESRPAALGIQAGRAEGLTKVGEITHGPEWDRGAIARSVVVGDRVFTISDFGVGANRMPGLQPLGFSAFAPQG